jgi:AcrR family transcriptional regulator
MPKTSLKTKCAILDAANRIVQEKGTEHLTLEQTAHEAGISKGGLLYHYPSKEALIKGMILDYLDRFTTDLNNAAEKAKADTTGRWTRAYLHTTYEDNQRTPRMSSGLLAAIATNPSLLSPMQQGFQDWIQLLEKDGINPVTATIVRLAVDGLWMVELFGLAPPNLEMREKVLHALTAMINP